MPEDKTVTWVLPDWAAVIIRETLELDMRSPAFDPKLRKEIEKACGAIQEQP